MSDRRAMLRRQWRVMQHGVKSQVYSYRPTEAEAQQRCDWLNRVAEDGITYTVEPPEDPPDIDDRK